MHVNVIALNSTRHQESGSEARESKNVMPQSTDVNHCHVPECRMQTADEQLKLARSELDKASKAAWLVTGQGHLCKSPLSYQIPERGAVGHKSPWSNPCRRYLEWLGLQDVLLHML